MPTFSILHDKLLLHSDTTSISITPSALVATKQAARFGLERDDIRLLRANPLYPSLVADNADLILVQGLLAKELVSSGEGADKNVLGFMCKIYPPSRNWNQPPPGGLLADEIREFSKRICQPYLKTE